MQLLHYITTCCHMGEFSCLLCDQLDFQRNSIFWNVHDYVPLVQRTILLDNHFRKLLVLREICCLESPPPFFSSKWCWNLRTIVCILQLIVVAGMGPILALKYFRYTYRPSKINTLQQAERLGGPILSLGSIQPQPRPIDKEVAPLSITQPKMRNPVYEPLLSDSPNSTRRSFGPGAPFDFFQSQSRLSASYSRNCKDNWKGLHFHFHIWRAYS